MKPFAPARRTLLAAFALTPLLLAGTTRRGVAAINDTGNAATSAKGAPSYRIDIHNFAFAPKELTVPAGARIVWTNLDDEPHTIVSAAGAFKPSQALDTNDSFATVLDKPGTYAYFCGIHPMMVGKIVVR
ncbi:MAG TPA: cupredoxin family copper-binding protein [Trinickia sp.]|uniref:cupredoxin domain-containing protein n=1 Tax=Trinickia sp. TaxID=2571163 RepID=UPI002B5405D8|nr:cupredoxin family copper-binding protein [Trinickia sp.]HVW52288.1 cupredoxin family copper-binding protein [Trinickia sp.]